jgi:hypothetical protein
MLGNLIALGVAFLFGYGVGYTGKNRSPDLDDLCRRADAAHKAAEAADAADAEQAQRELDKEEE